MVIQQEMEKIKLQLEVDDSQDRILSDLFTAWSALALGMCNRTALTPAMAGAVRDTVIAAYRRRGGEGMSSAKAGDQSYAYESLRQELLDRLLAANQRVFQP